MSDAVGQREDSKSYDQIMYIFILNFHFPHKLPHVKSIKIKITQEIIVLIKAALNRV